MQRARAFVGVITHASKEREWVYYEAGAAWGRGQVYAPLLIDMVPGDLTSSIADYQAVRANSNAEVSRLVEALAQAVGGQVKARFAKRYQAFAKAVADYQRERDKGETRNQPSQNSPLADAIRLMQQGKMAEAEATFERLEAEATSQEELTSLRFRRVINGKEEGIELLERVEALEDRFKQSAEYLFWAGILEPRPLVGIASLERCVEAAKLGSHTHREATIGLAIRNARIGRNVAATAVLATALRASDRQLRAEAADLWLKDLFPDLELSPTSRLLLLACGLSGRRTPSLLDPATELALKENWPSLLAALAEWYGSVDDSASVANTVGRAYAHLLLPSLAYRWFSKASEGGISVARSNLAGLVLHGPVAAAGLALLEAHSGSFDAASRSYPHHVRAALEEAIEKEEKRACELEQRGGRLLSQLFLIADLGLGDDQERELSTEERTAVYETVYGHDFSRTESAERDQQSSPKWALQRTLPYFNVWHVLVGGQFVGMAHVGKDGILTGFRATLESGEAEMIQVSATLSSQSG